MDSGNSSSMQSSSGGGEEEYDSRADHSISAFFNHHNSASSAARSTTLPATLYHNQDNIGGGPLPDPHHVDPLFSNYFTNFDNTVWSSKSVRPGSDLAGAPSEPVFFTNPPSLPHVTPNTTSGSVPNDGGDINNKGNNMVRNPKKRSRASRRAPTTVLTTDTTNFRAMVQEFTGIPAPPFTGSSPFPRTGRFDLFGSVSSNSSFPFKPFAQKLIPPSFLSSSSSSSSSSPSSSSSSTAILASSSSSSSSFSPSSSSYYLPSAEHQNLLNMINTNPQGIANPFLDINSPKDPLTDPSIFAAKSKPLFDQSQNIKVGNVLDVYGHHGGLQSIVSSSLTSTLMHRSKNCSDSENVEADLLRSINGGGFGESAHRATAAASGSSPAPENNLTTAKNGGMVESWICSSD